MLRAIHITKLFNLFDYPINLNNEEGITILTGPNGYGKTTILKIIHAIARKNFFYFLKLSFKKITLIFDDSSLNITLEKKSTNNYTIRQGKKPSLSISRESLDKQLQIILRERFFRQIDEDKWIDRRNDNIFDISTLIERVIPELSEYQHGLFENGFPSIPDVYLIREQRLLKRIQRKRSRQYYSEDEMINHFGETIEEYAKELKDHITDTLATNSQITQELDSSFPRRLFEERNEISEEDFNIRFEKIKEIQKALNKYELSVIREDNHPTYKKENAKALMVYLNDTEAKLEVFHKLLEKLDLFTGILNERRFAFKKIQISKEDGFKFLTKDNNPLSLTDLSSGEQQEVVLLFELLFKVKPGTLVLIDEPEISLHVAWQKEFLNDLIKVTELQRINTIIATHSPQIINERWDLTLDLEELIHEKVS